MGAFDDRLPPRGPLNGARGGESWDDWDPTNARRGYTEQIGALRGLGAPSRNPIDLPEPTLARVPNGEAAPLSPAALALSARADTEDYSDRHV